MGWVQGQKREFLLTAIEAGVHEEAFYTLAIETGMRKGELCGLKWEDVDLAARRISVKRTLCHHRFKLSVNSNTSCRLMKKEPMPRTAPV